MFLLLRKFSIINSILNITQVEGVGNKLCKLHLFLGNHDTCLKLLNNTESHNSKENLRITFVCINRKFHSFKWVTYVYFSF